MSIFNVSEKKEKELRERMCELNVNEDDLEEKFIQSSGPGGRKANKTSSCVFLRHVPTDITVKYQRERSQALNRFFARRTLLDKIERVQKGFTKEEEKRIEKIKSQKRKKRKLTIKKLSAVHLKQSDIKQKKDE